MTLEPTTSEFVQSLGTGNGLPTVEQARRDEESRQAAEVPLAAADIDDLTLTVGPSAGVPLRVVRPAGNGRPLPPVMYFHGGGWVLGGKLTHDRLVRQLAVGAESAVVFVDYARSPEVRYPVANEQAFAATSWIAEHGESLGLNPTRLAVAGDSSGGNMAAAVTLMAKDRGGPTIAAQVLFFPAMDAGFDSPSYRQFAAGPFLTADMMKWFWDHYAPDPAARRQVTATPLSATPEQLRELPPALVITAENDVLRDEGEAYARKLIQAGVEVTAARYLGTIHAFVVLNSLAATPAARAAIAQAAEFLKLRLQVHPRGAERRPLR